ncbi:hypothetical protein EW146_g10043, partial [Bondarzewia mesenterica]
DRAPSPQAAHLRAAEEHLDSLERVWLERCRRARAAKRPNGSEELKKQEEGEEEAFEPRPPPSASAVVHLPFPSSPASENAAVGTLLAFVAFVERLLDIDDAGGDVVGKEGKRDRTMGRPAKVLIYSSDGYTESSVLALCLLMSVRGLTLPEAYLELQVAKKRSFFVYPADIGVLKRVEQKLAKDRQFTVAGRNSHVARPFSHPHTHAHVHTRTSTFSWRLSASYEEHSLSGASSGGNGGPVGQIRRPRASTSPLLPSLVSDHHVWFDDPRFDGSFPSRVLPFLYLGNLNHATNAYMLHALGITHVVSVGECALVPPPDALTHGNDGGKPCAAPPMCDDGLRSRRGKDALAARLAVDRGARGPDQGVGYQGGVRRRDRHARAAVGPDLRVDRQGAGRGRERARALPRWGVAERDGHREFFLEPWTSVVLMEGRVVRTDRVRDEAPHAAPGRRVLDRALAPVVGADSAEHALVVQSVRVGGEVGARAGGGRRDALACGARAQSELAVPRAGGARAQREVFTIIDSASPSQAVQVAIPAEILGRIVELTLLDEMFRPDSHGVFRSVRVYDVVGRPNERARMLLNLSHVSRYWRAVIISHASLWSSIEGPGNAGDDIINLCVERSKDVPLHMTNFCYPRSTPLLSRESHRLVYLWLRVFPGSSHISRMHFPLLECLVLSKSQSYTTHDLSGLISEFPRLRRLWLDNFTYWPVYRFLRLTHLALSSTCSLTNSISMIELLDVLRENAGLQVLVLDEMDLTLGHAERPQPVELAHLRYLVINDDKNPSHTTISAMTLPSTMTARFRTHYTRWKSKASVFPAKMNAGSFFSDDTAVSLVAWSGGNLSYFLYNSDCKFEVLLALDFDIHTDLSLRPLLPVEDPSWIRELSLEISSNATSWTPRIDAVLRLTPGVTKLTISAITAFDCSLWFAAILRGALPELKTLCIHLRDVTGLLRLSPLFRLARQRYVDGRPLKNVVICDERLKTRSSCAKTLRRIARYIDRLELDSSPSPFTNSDTGSVYASLPDDLRSWNWRDEFRY